MSTERKGVEIYVGLFLLIGIGCIGLMFIRFGGMMQGLSNTYTITVEFDNASGLVKDAQVLLAGATIGKVAEKPKLLIRDGFGVAVTLRISEDVRIPRDATIVVDQSGLLGDCYIDVIPPPKIDKKNLIEPNETVVGGTKPGLAALQQQGTTALGKLTETLDELKKITSDLHTGLLNDENLKNLSDTFASLKSTGENLSSSSKKLDGILEKGDGAVDAAKKTFETADKAAADLRSAMTDFKRVAEGANKTLDSARGFVETGTRVLKKAEQGEGALGMLLTDKETAENLKAFASNLRRSGPVFYKDREPKEAPEPRRRR